MALKEEKARTLKQNTIGLYDLKALDIKPVHIPKSWVEELKSSTNSSLGVLKKFNVADKKYTYYIKSGASRGMYFNIRQPIMEKIASNIGMMIGLDVVEYKLWVIDRELFEGIEGADSKESEFSPYSGSKIEEDSKPSLQKCLAQEGKVLVSICRSFLSEGESFHSCDKLFKDTSQSNLYKDLCEMNKGTVTQIDQMILFDYLIHNTDRHRKNFGFIQSEEDGYRFSPLFDHGLSFLCDFEESEIIEHGMDLVSFEMGKPFGNLVKARELINRESVKNLNWQLPSSELLLVLEPYAEVLGETRIRLMKRIIETRWENAKSLFSQV